MYSNIECAILSGATAKAIKIAFDAWRHQWDGHGNHKKANVVCCTMFGVTDLIVFYFRETV